MPSRSLQPCRHPGCISVQVGPYCDMHDRLRKRQASASAHKPEHQRLYDRRWRRIRAEQLSKEPWCAECLRQGIHTLATDVDHVERHAGNIEKFYKGPFESLCHTCHSSKTALEVGLNAIPPAS